MVSPFALTVSQAHMETELPTLFPESLVCVAKYMSCLSRELELLPKHFRNNPSPSCGLVTL